MPNKGHISIQSSTSFFTLQTNNVDEAVNIVQCAIFNQPDKYKMALVTDMSGTKLGTINSRGEYQKVET